MNRSLSLASMALVFALAACGKKDSAAPDAPKGGSCDKPSEGSCEEYKDSALGLAEGFCKTAGGTYEKKSCSKDKLIGTCVKESGDKEYVYEGNGMNQTTADAKDDCEKNPITKGKWTDGPSAAAAKDRKAPEASKIKYSCDKSEELNSCDDYSVTDVADMHKSMCDSMKGKYATAGCPSANLVGSCVFPEGRTTRYYLPVKKDAFTMTADERKKDCEMDMLGKKGAWIAGPAAAAAAGSAAPSAKATGGGAAPKTTAAPKGLPGKPPAKK